MHQDATWYRGRPWPRRYCVTWGPSYPSPKRGRSPSPQFPAHVYCGQKAGWIKVALGMEVGLGPRRIVIDGDPAPLSKNWTEPPPIFGPFLLWPNGSMRQDATWYGGRPQLSRLRARWGPSYSQKKGTPTPPNFWPMSIVAKTAGWMKTPLGTKVDLGPGHFLLDGFPAIRERGTTAPPPLSIVATVAHLSYC